MKFSLIVAVAMLVLAQGSNPLAAVNPDAIQAHLEQIKEKMVQSLTEIIQNNNLTNQAQTFAQDSKTQLEPVAANIEQQLKTVATHLEEQIKPLAANMQTEIQSRFNTFQTQIEAILQQLTSKARTTDN